MYRQIVIALFSVICCVLLATSEAQDEERGMSSYKRFADNFEGSEGGQSLPALVRFGKRGPLPALVRFGKRSFNTMSDTFGKRGKIPAIVRFGKRSPVMNPENHYVFEQADEEPLSHDNWVMKFRR